MNGRPFTAAEDAAILANAHLGRYRLGKLLNRAPQSVRDRRERLLTGEPLYGARG